MEAVMDKTVVTADIRTNVEKRADEVAAVGMAVVVVIMAGFMIGAGIATVKQLFEKEEEKG